MNSGNPLSNSKHSLFDHFKRNLDLECNIPKFDVNTGILTAKQKLNESKSNENQQLSATYQAYAPAQMYHQMNQVEEKYKIQTYDLDQHQHQCSEDLDYNAQLQIQHQQQVVYQSSYQHSHQFYHESHYQSEFEPNFSSDPSVSSLPSFSSFLN